MNLEVVHRALRDEILDRLRELIDAGSFVGGEEVLAFEREFAAFCDLPYVISCGSGTDALTLALRAVGVGPGTVVLTTPLTFIATAEAVTLAGGRVAFVDVDEETGTLSPERLDDRLRLAHRRGERVAAVIPVHLFGLMANMDDISRVASRYGVPVIEDAAQAHAATRNGKGPGRRGLAAAFSFFPSKNLGAFGDAGAVATHDAALAERIRLLATHGRTDKYVYAVEGTNSRLDAIQAAVLRIKLPHVAAWAASRTSLARQYAARLQTLHPAVRLPTEPADTVHAFHLYAIRVDDRERVLSRMLAAGIEVGVHYRLPLHLQPAYRYLDHHQGDFPAAEVIGDQTLSLPLWPGMSESMVSLVCRELEQAVAPGSEPLEFPRTLP